MTNATTNGAETMTIEQLQKEIDALNAKSAQIKKENTAQGEWPKLSKKWKLQKWVLALSESINK